jgi:hypothetical protein
MPPNREALSGWDGWNRGTEKSPLVERLAPNTQSDQDLASVIDLYYDIAGCK